LQEILKQPQYAPVSLENQVITLFAATNGYSDAVPLERVRAWESDLLRTWRLHNPEIGKDIGELKRITDEIRLPCTKRSDLYSTISHLSSYSAALYEQQGAPVSLSITPLLYSCAERLLSERDTPQI